MNSLKKPKPKRWRLLASFKWVNPARALWSWQESKQLWTSECLQSQSFYWDSAKLLTTLMNPNCSKIHWPEKRKATKKRPDFLLHNPRALFMCLFQFISFFLLRPREAVCWPVRFPVGWARCCVSRKSVLRWSRWHTWGPNCHHLCAFFWRLNSYWKPSILGGRKGWVKLERLHRNDRMTEPHSSHWVRTAPRSTGLKKGRQQKNSQIFCCITHAPCSCVCSSFAGFFFFGLGKRCWPVGFPVGWARCCVSRKSVLRWSRWHTWGPNCHHLCAFFWRLNSYWKPVKLERLHRNDRMTEPHSSHWVRTAPRSTGLKKGRQQKNSQIFCCITHAPCSCVCSSFAGFFFFGLGKRCVGPCGFRWGGRAVACPENRSWGDQDGTPEAQTAIASDFALSFGAWILIGNHPFWGVEALWVSSIYLL